MGELVKFQQLRVWQESHKLVLTVYTVTKTFPSDERFGLISQMRRAAISVPANIAEGFKRRDLAEKIRFYNISEGSLEELKYYFILAYDLKYLSENESLFKQSDLVGRLLSGLITSTDRRR
ncbi:MAG: four helix bundle protein [Anaerolineales bacterium]|nr:four helix bundle protein [Anaerolineales bacterium]